MPKDLILRHVLPYVLDGGADDRAGAAERFERLLETEAVLPGETVDTSSESKKDKSVKLNI